MASTKRGVGSSAPHDGPEPELQTGRELLRTLVPRRIGVLVAIAWAVFGLMHVAAGRPAVTVVHALVAIVSAAAHLAVQRHPIGSTYVIGVASVLGLVAVAAMTGGVTAPAITFLGMVPLMAGLLESRWHRLGWLALALLAMVAVDLLRPWVPDESYYLNPWEHLAGPMGLGVLVFFAGSLWRESSTAQLRLLEARQAEIEAQTRRLTEQGEQLAQAREAAELASAAKSRFIAVAAHELRGPLNGVLGMARVLDQLALRGVPHDLATSLVTSAESANKLLRELLDLSKIEAGRVEVLRNPYEPRELVADVLDTFAAAASKKQLALGCVARPGVPIAVSDDADRLRQVIGNLVGNAIKFTEAGEVRVTIDVAGDTLIYSVEDTGPGIDPADVERIFAPFEQVSEALLARRAGTGLGLWISRSHVDALGGRMRVEAGRARGSTFVVELPLIVARLTQPERTAEPVRIAASVSGELATASLASACDELGASLSLLADREAVARTDAPVVLIDADERADAELLDLAGAVPAQARLVIATSPAQLPRVSALLPGRARTIVLKPHRASRLQAVIRDDAPSAPSLAPPEPMGTLLVVDDDEINRKVVTYAAGQLGYRVVEADGGAGALAALDAGPIDVALIDLHMEPMDGIETVKAIDRRLGPQIRPAILGYTGTVQEADRARCIAAGMDEVLAKPLDHASLGAALARARRQAARRKLRGSIARTDALPVLHEETLRTLVTSVGDRALATQLARELADDLAARVQRVTTAIRDENRPALKREAHTLAAAAATFGVARLALACRRIESTCETAALSELEARAVEVETRAAEARPALAEWAARAP